MNKSRIVVLLSSLRRLHIRRSQEGPAEGRPRTLGTPGGAEGWKEKSGSALTEGWKDGGESAGG